MGEELADLAASAALSRDGARSSPGQVNPGSGVAPRGAPVVRPSTLPADERFGLLAVTGSAERDRGFSLQVDAGVVLLRWTPGVHITGPLAAEAMATVNDLNGDQKRPLLVDMSGTARLTREARETFRRDCQVSRMAIVGTSAVDKVIANFGMRVTTIEIPSRYFTSVPAALAWLRDGEPSRS